MMELTFNLKRITTLALIVSLLVVSGCASKMLKPYSSYQVEDFPATGIEVIANHLSDELAGIFPPGHTTFFIHQAQADNLEEDAMPLGAVLDQALRSRGFSVAAISTEKALAVAYVLDMIDPNTCYTRLTISNGLTLTRTYQFSGDNFDNFEVVGVTRTSIEGQKQ